MLNTIKCILSIIILLAVVLSCQNETVVVEENFLFKELKASKTKLEFTNTIKDTDTLSIINYIYFYNGAGVSTGDVNNDGLPDLFFVSNMGKNKLFINKGDLEFEDISQTAGVSGGSSWNTGSTFVDINNDGYLDIYVCAVSGLFNFNGQNELFINNGDNTFTESAEKYGLNFKGYSTQSYFFDFDKDGDLDVYIVNHAVHTNLSHGKADVRNKRVPLVGDVLLRNDDGYFRDVSEIAGIFGGSNGYGLSAAIGDFNSDGWDDIYVCNDFHEDDYFYINNQDGSFTENLGAYFSHTSRFSMGCDVADINHDGYQDLITLDMLPGDEHVLKTTEGDDVMLLKNGHLRNMGYKEQYSRNMLQLNQQGEYFKEIAVMSGVADTDWSWSPLFADFNNDGYQDLFISNGILRRPNGLDFTKYVSNAFRGRNDSDAKAWLFKSINEMPSGTVPNEIFMGEELNFSSKIGEWIKDEPKLSNGAVYSDLDLDGDLDLIMNNLNTPASILENTSDTLQSFASFKLDYQDNNKNGIGAKVSIYTDRGKQLKQLFNSRGFVSSVSNSLHFGLGKSQIIDSVVVHWPNLQKQVFTNTVMNQYTQLNYDEEQVKALNLKEQNTRKETVFKLDQVVDFEHKEDSYNDFLRQKLIPYRISGFGPAVAKGDIDNNGYEDIFIGSAIGQQSVIFYNDGINFEKATFTDLRNDIYYEDNDATLFDADGDGDLDLFVVSGMGNQIKKVKSNWRFYRNNNGVFEKDIDAVPNSLMISSVVTHYDFDADGDEDLFIGNISEIKSFGGNVDSYLLENNGDGTFEISDKLKLKSKVTDAIWRDVDGDGTKDLMVSTHWDAPKILLNKNNSFETLNLPNNINGLWETIALEDVDKDGDKDVVLGNWGLNTKFSLYSEGDLLMYYSDFDNNGTYETVLSYKLNGKYYPLNSRMELSSQMNFISKKYVDNATFAGKTITEIFGKDVVDKAEKYRVNTLTSGYIRNVDGAFKQFVELPQEFQTSPVKIFKELEIKGEKFNLAAGNLVGMNSFHGRYTSMKGLIMSNLDSIRPISDFGINPFNKEIEAIVSIKMKENDLLVVIPNSGMVTSYRFTK